MTREEHVKICSLCRKRAFNGQKGLVCGLTNEYADFENQCVNYDEDQQEIKQREKEALESEEMLDDAVITENVNMRGSSWFGWIGALSIVNIIASFVNVRMIFGLGVTEILQGLLGFVGIALGLLFSSLYLGIYYYAAKKEKEWAYRLGYYVYFFDAILIGNILMHSENVIIDFLLHVGLLFYLYYIHPFFGKRFKDKRAVENWSVGRIVMTVVSGLCMAVTIFLGMLII